MSTIRNKRLLRTLEQANFRQVPVNDLKKVARAIDILQQTNARLCKVIKTLRLYYERKYKLKLANLQCSVETKRRRIAELQEKLSPAYLFVVRKDNCIHLHEHFAQVNAALLSNASTRVLLCRISQTSHMERALCVAVAKSKFGDNVVTRDDDTVVFLRTADADEYERDVRVMFSE
ncbi:hypothetical protein pesp024 [Peridroma alphabaculovirus]|uniref:Uncharacterized protein n=1 Tax=Peridroma alphabaculovirus TaxID=1346829 RepID=A0A068LRC6_9ABAC|nr:hypothetical protein pesp024 [Peridroma alphabaculovirus]AIE47755.1 hypothetical protein pesp024 [Peridroma alphabaculovirus]